MLAKVITLAQKMREKKRSPSLKFFSLPASILKSKFWFVLCTTLLFDWPLKSLKEIKFAAKKKSKVFFFVFHFLFFIKKKLTFSSETSRDLRLLPTTLNSSSNSTILDSPVSARSSARSRSASTMANFLATWTMRMKTLMIMKTLVFCRNLDQAWK